MSSLLKLIKVKGTSMSPDLGDGDYVLVLNKFFSQPKSGDIILFNHHIYGQSLKEFVSCDNLGIRVQGKNPHSLNSSSLGTIPRKSVFGKIIFHFKKSQNAIKQN